MVYVKRFTDPLPHYLGPEEGAEWEGGGRVEENGGGQNWREGKRGKFCARRSKRGGATRGGRYKFTMRIILKGKRNILNRLIHLNYFFGFVLADFTLLTWNLKKYSHISIYIPKQKSVYIVQGANKKCLEMHDYVPLF